MTRTSAAARLRLDHKVPLTWIISIVLAMGLQGVVAVAAFAKLQEKVHQVEQRPSSTAASAGPSTRC